MDTKYQPESRCRWGSYKNYRLIVWAWMMNEVSTVHATAHMSHYGFYLHVILYALSAIFVGLPLLYSEVCITQYTNCNSFTMWNYFPLLRGVGYSAVFLVILKTLYVMVLAIWYIEYAVLAATDSPPWFSCDDFNDSYCMVKRINISIFQHCLETQFLFQEDCGMRTASYCFFYREIGNNNTLKSTRCMYSWKQLITSAVISATLFLFSLKNEKFVQIFVKILVCYISASVFILLIVSLSTSGSWMSTKTILEVIGENDNLNECLRPVSLGFLSVGTGYGMLSYFTKDVPFRSHAMMTVVSTLLFSMCITFLLALVIFSGIRTMSYYHGEEENIIEFADSYFFFPLASVSEILMYFDEITVWSFIWYSSIFMCLYVTLWMQYVYLRDLLLDNIYFASKHHNLISILLSVSVSVLSWPFLCSDLTSAISDSLEVLQICSNFLFSISLYWIYGYKKHSIDIVFMIGIKSSYFWQICWMLNPILVIFILCTKLDHWADGEFDDSLEISSLNVRFDQLIFLIFLSIYFGVVIIGTLFEMFLYCKHDKIVNVVFPSENWGPIDTTLYRSRQMFVPEIMTREFLYRQVRIRGHKKSRNNSKKFKKMEDKPEKVSFEVGQWSVLTSN